uniref:Uncharacterized protein n=1 Tax=Myoviridae sp. ct0e511 TaxID=2825013 RepID=A0A8S5QJ02_9CAUD|nr:MAG TPA: hypothetical protein [Myoviridae sp. ct0e511]
MCSICDLTSPLPLPTVENKRITRQKPHFTPFLLVCRVMSPDKKTARKLLKSHLTAHAIKAN